MSGLLSGEVVVEFVAEFGGLADESLRHVGGDERLAECETTIVGWQVLVRQGRPPDGAEPVDAPLGQERVLEHAARQDHGVGALAEAQGERGDQLDDGDVVRWDPVSLTGVDDVVVRVSGAAEGRDAVGRATDFARALSIATGTTRRGGTSGSRAAR